MYDLAKADFHPSVLHDVTIEKQADISVACVSEQDCLTDSHDDGNELACRAVLLQTLEAFKQGQQSVSGEASGNV